MLTHNHFETSITTCHWTRDHAAHIEATPFNTFPAFDVLRLRPLIPDYHVWDSWFVMDETGHVANVLGYRILIALTRPVHDRHGTGERIAYFYSKDGHNYYPGGFLFAEKIYHDIREWSGSTILREDGLLQTFYTIAKGEKVSGIWQTSQRFATAIQSVRLQGNGDNTRLIIEPEQTHVMLIEPDGLLYETIQQAAERERRFPSAHAMEIGSDQCDNFCFRDPKFYKDPVSQKSYLLFEGNTGPSLYPPGSVHQGFLGSPQSEYHYQPTSDDLKANGCVGVLELTNANYTFGVFQRPWLTANLVTDEIERINVLHANGFFYLFVVAHGNKCTLLQENEDLRNRDYLLGFRADTLFGRLTPLNDSGVILQQKSFGNSYEGQDNNQQYVYSWLLVPTQHENRFDCISYANYSGDDRGVIQAIKTAGPTVTIEIEGLNTRIIDKKHDILPISYE